MQVELVVLGGVLGVRQRGVEDLDDLVPAQLLAVVLDQDRARERVGLEIVDPQDAHQLALDGLAELGLAVDDRVLEPQPPGQLVLDLPVRDDRAVSEVADLALGVTDRGDRRDGHAERLERGGGRERPGRRFDSRARWYAHGRWNAHGRWSRHGRWIDERRWTELLRGLSESLTRSTTCLSV